jgi:hypothetical protein
MTPHAQEPTPVHPNRIGLHGQRGAPGLAVLYASHTVVFGRRGGVFDFLVLRPALFFVFKKLFQAFFKAECSLSSAECFLRADIKLSPLSMTPPHHKYLGLRRSPDHAFLERHGGACTVRGC